MLQDYQQEEMPMLLAQAGNPERDAAWDGRMQGLAAIEQQVIAREQEKRKKLAEFQASPQGQAMMQQEAENRALQQAFRANPRLQEQFLIKQAQARADRANTPRRQQVVQTDNGPMLLDDTGRASPILGPTGAPVKSPERAEKPMTEFQGKAALYGTRMQNSHDILSAIEEKTSQTGIAVKRGLQDTPVIGGILGAGANLLLSNDQQSIEQAQRDFINATLRQESGAVISQPEFENAQRQYFPQPGDNPALLKQKRRNREIAISGFERMAGKEGGDAIREIRNKRGGDASSGGFQDQEKERRYQEWKAKQPK